MTKTAKIIVLDANILLRPVLGIRTLLQVIKFVFLSVFLRENINKEVDLLGKLMDEISDREVSFRLDTRNFGDNSEGIF